MGVILSPIIRPDLAQALHRLLMAFKCQGVSDHPMRPSLLRCTEVAHIIPRPDQICP